MVNPLKDTDNTNTSEPLPEDDFLLDGPEGAAVADTGITAALESQLNAIPDDQKLFVSEHLTPEISAVFGFVLGEEAFNFFNQFADPTRVLIPMDRAAAEKQLGGPVVQVPNMDFLNPLDQVPEQEDSPLTETPEV